jgi:hypothetical protein
LLLSGGKLITPSGFLGIGAPIPPAYDIIAGVGTDYPALADGIAAMPAGGSMGITDGTYPVLVLPASAGDCTVAAINPRQVIIDGSTGPSGTQRGIQVSAPASGIRNVTISGIWFQNAGVGNPAGGEAGLWFALNAGGTVYNCQFDHNQNGLFTVANAAPVYGIRNEFGLVTSNGQSQDGKSHDVYAESTLYSETDCYHYGNTWGHSLKSRSPTTTVSGGLYTYWGGRAIEFTDGGVGTVDSAYISGVTGTIANMLGYADENDGAPNGVAGPCSFMNCTLVAIAPNLKILFGNGGTMSFSGTTQIWVNNGHGDPSIQNQTLSGGIPGTITGLSLLPGTIIDTIPPFPHLP